jgi:hypothetical protein
MNNNRNRNVHKSIEDRAIQKDQFINVFGQRSEPTCNYFRCHHKFSEHGSIICRCKHPQNSIVGIQKISR